MLNFSTAKAAVARAAQDRDLYQEALGSLILKATHGSLVPSVRVQFSNLTIEAKGELAGQDNPSVLNSAINTLPIKRIITKLNSKSSYKDNNNFVRVLDNATGVLEPGRLTLLLGPPGSGKSLLQSALAGRLKPQKGSLKVQGAVTYNGIDINTLESGRIVGWVRQRDVHLPKLSVLETTTFAMECLLDPPLQHRILNALLGGDDSVMDKKDVSKHLEIARTASGALSADCVFEELATKLSKMKSVGFVALESGQASKIEEESGSGGAGHKSSKLPGLLDDLEIDNEQKDIIMYV
jgi:energy-coupling factor transporter ATP-binding protein EcfA2